MAGPAEAAPGTLITHLQLSEKRRAEVEEESYLSDREMVALPADTSRQTLGGVYTQEGTLKGGPWEKGREVPG